MHERTANQRLCPSRECPLKQSQRSRQLDASEVMGALLDGLVECATTSKVNETNGTAPACRAARGFEPEASGCFCFPVCSMSIDGPRRPRPHADQTVQLCLALDPMQAKFLMPDLSACKRRWPRRKQSIALLSVANLREPCPCLAGRHSAVCACSGDGGEDAVFPV